MSKKVLHCPNEKPASSREHSALRPRNAAPKTWEEHRLFQRAPHLLQEPPHVLWLTLRILQESYVRAGIVWFLLSTELSKGMRPKMAPTSSQGDLAVMCWSLQTSKDGTLCLTVCYSKWPFNPFIVDLPIKNGDFP